MQVEIKRVIKASFALLLVVMMFLTSMPISVFAASNADVIFSFLTNQMGLNSAAACGVLANIEKESSFNPNASGDSGTSYGICQWHDSRFTALRNWCSSNGYDYTTLTGQLYYLKKELSANNSSYLWNGKTIYDKLAAVANTADGAYNAGYIWCYYYEVPANKETRAQERGNSARNSYWPVYGNGSTPSSCNCDTSYAGQYTCTASSLFIRSGHGTSYPDVGSIPYGATVTVTKGNGSWAHVTYGNVSGYASMAYLEKIDEPEWDYKLDVWASTKGGANFPHGQATETTTGIVGNAYYVWYKLYSAGTGALYNGNNDYDATISVYKPDGTLQYSYSYENSSCNWIRFTPTQIGYYTMNITLTGEITGNLSQNFYVGCDGVVSFDKSSMTLTRPTATTGKLTISLSGNWPENAGFLFEYDEDVVSYTRDGVTLTITAKQKGYTTFRINIVDKANNDALITSASCGITVNNKAYTVSYNANGGAGAPSSQTKYYEETLYLSSTIPSRTGYVFKGWATSSTATTAKYQPGGKYTLNSGTTLYAVWDKMKATIVYDANGGSGAPSSQIKYYGQTLYLSTVKPVRSGYTFKGWSIFKAENTVAKWQPGEAFTSNISENGAVVTLYAVWECNHAYTNACDTSCNTCGATRSIKHSYSNECDTNCNVCGYIRTVSGHSYNSTVTKAATCGAAGTRKYTCKYCSASYTETIPATGNHTYTNACDTSCNTCGSTRSITHSYSNECDTSCNVCGNIRTVGDHSYNSTVTKVATCGTTGTRKYTCKYCSASYTETIPATENHTYSNACDVDCNTCHAVRKVSGHMWKDGACSECGTTSSSQVVITTQPKTTYAKEGVKVSVKVDAQGDGLTYQWYIKNDGENSYSKSSVTSSTYSATMGDKVHGRRVYCIVTDQYGNQVQSFTALLRRQATITKESATAAYAKKGAKVSVKVTALGDGLTYAWYIKNDGKSSYSKSSVTSATYSATMSSKVKGRKVYCIVTDKYGKKVQSKTFVLRESVSIVTQPKTVTVAKNKTAKVTVKASGDGLKYTWYIKNAGSSKYSKSSVTKSAYSVKMTSKVKNRLVYCVVTDKYGKTVKSTTVKLKMK